MNTTAKTGPHQAKPSAAVIRRMESETEIAATFTVMRQLRPHLEEQSYPALMQEMRKQGYLLAAVLEGSKVQCVAGYRFGQSLSWGRFLYVDDLVTAEEARSKGYGKLLFDWLVTEAKAAHCAELHLDSGVKRHEAHRFYLRERMDIVFYHFARSL